MPIRRKHFIFCRLISISSKSNNQINQTIKGNMKYFLIVMLLVIVSACSSESVETTTESITVDMDTTAVNTVEVDSVSVEVVENGTTEVVE